MASLFYLYQKWNPKFKNPEEIEQMRFVQWLESNGYKYYACPNSTWTKSIMQRVRNTLMGVSAGVPDLCIILKKQSILYIEMKRPRNIKKNGELGSSPSKCNDPDQLEWIYCLSSVDNVDAIMCYGCEDAIETVIRLEK